MIPTAELDKSGHVADMMQVELIRGRILRFVRELSIYISCLPEREQEALEKLCGDEGQRTAARITEFTLVQLGNKPSTNKEQYQPSYRQAQEFVPDLPPERRKPGRPRANPEQAEA